MSQQQVVIPRHLTSIHLYEMIQPEVLHRFSSLQNSINILSDCMNNVYGEEFSKLVYDCVYYYEQALVEEQLKLYQIVKEKLVQFKDNIEEDQWAIEHSVCIGDDEDKSTSATTLDRVKHFEKLLQKLEELREKYETKLPSIGDKTRLIDVLDDLHRVLLSAENYKSQLLSLLEQGNEEREEIENVISHHPHAHLKYNSFKTDIGQISEKEEMISLLKNYVNTQTKERLEQWQREGALSVESFIEHQNLSPNHSLHVDTTPYNAVLKQYYLLFSELYRHVLDINRCVTLYAITVSNSEKTKIVYIGNTTDIKRNFKQFVTKSSEEQVEKSAIIPLLKVATELLHPKFEGMTKKIHLFTLDEKDHVPLELDSDFHHILEVSTKELIQVFSPELNVAICEKSDLPNLVLDVTPFSKLNKHLQ
ncbi:predicted protein [Naegleria gruberi]|uniref:Predicted protein n=1 Tax=Naegleria gruberi TaxID=5762 RepID=D2VJP6_NAEGR|nr:uncharacterized protein NAEGRDRAFT_50102 [Naegleria gruberi]EFC43067.1 predicted protein [Naegleria gruberi]|eukprot:XP_002675811.1 predicted protein [Naegleria gruberi strain NEG-M]